MRKYFVGVQFVCVHSKGFGRNGGNRIWLKLIQISNLPGCLVKPLCVITMHRESLPPTSDPCAGSQPPSPAQRNESHATDPTPPTTFQFNSTQPLNSILVFC